MLVHENLVRIRKAKGVTKTTIAKRLGLSLQGYRYLENGESRLDVERLKIISQILDVDIFVFFDDKLTDKFIDKIMS